MRHLPWAGLLALVVVFGIDWWAFSAENPWPALGRSMSVDRPLEYGVTESQIQLRRVAAREPETPGVLVVGNSRLFTAFNPTLAEQALKGVQIGMLAAPARDPFIVRSMTDDMLSARPDAVVLLLSEFDTHRAVRMEPLPDNGSASLTTVAEIVRLTSPGFAFRNRHSIYRIVAAELLDSYRFREIVYLATAAKRLDFELDERRPPATLGGGGSEEAQNQELVLSPIAFFEGTPTTVTDELRQEIARQVRPRPGFDFLTEAVAEITTGKHVDVNMALLRETVRRLTESGCRVVIVEAPAHPAAALLYPHRARNEFVSFADRLVDEFGVTFLRLEEMPPFPGSDFIDLVHLGHRGPGVAKMTRSIAEGIARSFTDEPYRP